MRNRHDHILALDQVFNVLLEFGNHKLGPAWRVEFFFDLDQFAAQNLQQLFAAGQNRQILRDFLRDFTKFLAYFLTLKPGQAVQTQIENSFGLRLGHSVMALGIHGMIGIVDQFNQRRDFGCGPRLRQKAIAGLCGIFGLADQRDNFVNIDDGNGQAHQDMRALPRLAEFEDRTARDYFLAELDEGRDHVLEQHHLRLAVIERHHVAGEIRLQRRVPEQLVQNDIGIGVVFKLDDDAHAVTVGFVTDFVNVLNNLFPADFAEPFQQFALADLIRNFVNDDRFALADFLNRGLGTHDDRTVAGVVGAADSHDADNLRACGEIRAGDDLVQLIR